VRYFVILILLFANQVFAQSGSSSLNLAIPQSSGSYQSDRIRTGNTECQMAIGSATRVEFGVVGILNQNDPFSSNIYNNPNFDPTQFNNNDFVRDVGVYGRIVIPIGAPKERLDCAQLYKIELEKQRLELFKLKQEIQQLRQLQFEN
jgi:hypothetical protein